MPEDINGFGKRLNEAEKDIVRNNERTKFNSETIEKLSEAHVVLTKSVQGIQVKVAGIVATIAILSKVLEKLL